MHLEFSKYSLYLSYVVLMVLIITSAYTDIKHRKIYNKFTLSGIIVGLVLGGLIDFPGGLQSRFFGFVLGFGLFFLMFLSGNMGGGDVKLVAAIGALTGYPFIVDAIFFAILFGGVYAIIILLLKGLLWENLKTIFFFIHGFFIHSGFKLSLQSKSSVKIPYGLCISMGTLFALLLHKLTTINCFFFGY